VANPQDVNESAVFVLVIVCAGNESGNLTVNPKKKTAVGVGCFVLFEVGNPFVCRARGESEVSRERILVGRVPLDEVLVGRDDLNRTPFG
jgi:hypothetical protein